MPEPQQEAAVPQPEAAPEQPVESGLIALDDDNVVERIQVQDVPEVPADWRKLHPEQRVKLARLLPGDFVVHDGETVEDAAARVLDQYAAQPAPKAAEPVTAAVTAEAPKVAEQPLVDPKLMEALQKEANRENDKIDFMAKVMRAREPNPKDLPAPPPPVAPRVVEQTNAELAAGAAMVAKNTALAAKRVPPPPDKSEGTSVEVLRPARYIPDPKKNQGHLGARPVGA